MKKDQLYFFTFFGLVLITFVVSYFSMNYLFEVSTNHFLKSQIETSKREANEISSLIQFQFESGLSKEVIVGNLQRTIENSNSNSGFISMFDWSGVQICHPNPEKVGRQILTDETFIEPTIYNELDSNVFYDLLKEKTSDKNKKSHDSEIIYLYPVKDTDWIVASHANIESIKGQMKSLRLDFMLVYAASGILIVLLSVMMVRLISRKYEKALEAQNEGLSKNVMELSKLNHNLVLYKEKIDAKAQDETVNNKTENQSKKRILTYVKDTLIAIDTVEIAFIYTENTITYICCLDGKVYNSNSSLEDLYKDLDKTYFFRANRQFILSIDAITKIYKYGNNQLKIEITPRAPIDIIVSKNKAAEFKNWLSL